MLTAGTHLEVLGICGLVLLQPYMYHGNATTRQSVIGCWMAVRYDYVARVFFIKCFYKLFRGPGGREEKKRDWAPGT